MTDFDNQLTGSNRWKCTSLNLRNYTVLGEKKAVKAVEIYKKKTYEEEDRESLMWKTRP